MCLELRDHWVVPLIMAGFAGVAVSTGRPRRALRLAGVARGLCEAGQFSMPAVQDVRLEQRLRPARNKLSSAAVHKITAEGRQMSLAEAVAYALADEPEDVWREGRCQTPAKCELEVATKVARGLSAGRDQAYAKVRLGIDQPTFLI